jgi:acetoin utilization protein AcuA
LLSNNTASADGPEPRAEFESPQGRIVIYARSPSGFFGGLRLDEGIGDFAHYSSMIQKLDEFDRIACGKDGRVSIALLEDRVIVGYFACRYPKPTERWSKLGDLMYEMGAIEVSRNFRKLGMARMLIKTVLTEPFIEDKIAYMNGYSWHWDVVGSGYTVAEYRNVHLKLLEPYSFREFRTNEPNISLREENIFMARIGNRVSPEDQNRFKRLIFGRFP